ncbi:hypothetical protein EDD99_5178 [Streptomyces sp. 846.5]|nr:hypothetical protein EDD99_5178 [Streptomyces sp. 846.5]
MMEEMSQAEYFDILKLKCHSNCCDDPWRIQIGVFAFVGFYVKCLVSSIDYGLYGAECHY